MQRVPVQRQALPGGDSFGHVREVLAMSSRLEARFPSSSDRFHVLESANSHGRSFRAGERMEGVGHVLEYLWPRHADAQPTLGALVSRGFRPCVEI